MYCILTTTSILYTLFKLAVLPELAETYCTRHSIRSLLISSRFACYLAVAWRWEKLGDGGSLFGFSCQPSVIKHNIPHHMWNTSKAEKLYKSESQFKKLSYEANRKYLHKVASLNSSPKEKQYPAR